MQAVIAVLVPSGTKTHFKKYPKNPEREITCKRCIEVGANVDVQGGMEGLVSHLQRDHALKGQWICENCHKLYASEKTFRQSHGQM